MPTARRLRVEVVIVLGLSLGASAVYSIVSLVAKLTEERALGDQTVALNPSRSSREWLDFTYQFLDVFFGLFAVALVLYLLWQPGRSPFRRIGLDLTQPGRDAASGAAARRRDRRARPRALRRSAGRSASPSRCRPHRPTGSGGRCRSSCSAPSRPR